MAVVPLFFAQHYGLPRAVVWDAFVDPDLLGGWLGEAAIDPVEGGAYRLRWVGSPDFPPADGHIVKLVEPELLVVGTDVHGLLRVELHEVPGGVRGASTRVELTVTVDVSAPFRGRVEQNWARALDRLSELLRGHPVDWELPPAPASPVGAASPDAGLA